MTWLHRVFAFYINSSIHVALAAVSLLALTVLEFDLKVPHMLWAFVFLGSITGYNFVKYAKVAGLHHRSLTTALKAIQIFSFICFVLLCFVMVQLRFITLAIAGFLAMLTFFYAVPFLKNKNLRTLPFLKIFIVALVWAGATVLIPFAVSGEIWDIYVWSTFIQRLLVVIVLILPFEIRDVRYDSIALRTFPQQLGIRNTKIMGVFLLLVCLTIEFFKTGRQSAGMFALLVFSILLGIVLAISKTQQSRYFASFWVDGLPMVLLLVFLLLRNF